MPETNVVPRMYEYTTGRPNLISTLNTSVLDTVDHDSIVVRIHELLYRLRYFHSPLLQLG